MGEKRISENRYAHYYPFGAVSIMVLTEIRDTFFCRWRAKVIGTHGIFIGKEWWTIVMCIVATFAVA